MISKEASESSATRKAVKIIGQNANIRAPQGDDGMWNLPSDVSPSLTSVSREPGPFLSAYRKRGAESAMPNPD